MKHVLEMNNNCFNILDLPNELLFLIINNLNTNDVVYSLIDIDGRFAQMIFDPLFVHNLDMTCVTMRSWFDYSYSMDDKILSRICQTILPKIHDRVRKLAVEQHSLERIFTFNYPHLSTLSLINCQEEILLQHLTGRFVKEFLSFISIKQVLRIICLFPT